MTDRDQLHRWIDAYIDGRISADQMASLDASLRASSSARATFFDALHFHHCLIETADPPATIEADASVSSLGPRAVGSNWRTPVAIAAALLLTCAAVAVYVFMMLAPGAGVDDTNAGATVATFIDAAEGTTVYVDRDIADLGSDYRPGTYAIDAGSAAFLLSNRVAVTLAGKTELSVQSNMAATLMYGAAAFDCPPGATGYRVYLPDGVRVVDRGTRFAVVIGPDSRSEVFVIEGRVDVVAPDATRPLSTGETASVHAGRINAAEPIANAAPVLSDRMRTLLDDMRIDALGRDIALLASDRFSDTSGPGLGWAGPWHSQAPGVAVADGAAQITGPFEHASTGRPLAETVRSGSAPVYLGVAMSTVGTGPNGSVFIALGDGAHPQRMPHGVVVGFCDGYFAARLIDAQMQMAIADVGRVQTDRIHRLVARVEFNVDGTTDERLTLWVDADDESAEPAATLLRDLGDLPLEHLAIDAWQLPAERTIALDAVRLGRSFDAALPDLPAIPTDRADRDDPKNP